MSAGKAVFLFGTDRALRSWCYGWITPSEPPSALTPLSLGLVGGFHRAHEKDHRRRQITRLFERERATDQPWVIQGERERGSGSNGGGLGTGQDRKLPTGPHAHT